MGTFNYCFEKVEAPVKPEANYRIGEQMNIVLAIVYCIVGCGAGDTVEVC